MAQKFTPPKFMLDGYNCPFCGAFAHQQFMSVAIPTRGGWTNQDEARISQCRRCDQYAYWVKGQMVYPEASVAPMPNEDLGDDAKRDFMEARAIVQRSPRGAAALLRLSIQDLCIQLGLPGKNLNDDIAELVKRGLSVTIQQSLDIVRVTGNNAVHPGEMDLRDDQDTALKLFDL